MKTKKITLATIKSFIKKNNDNLFIDVCSKFNGMIDCIDSVNTGFDKVKFNTENLKNTLGIPGAWFVGDSRDWFTIYEDDKLQGFKISNCCGSFIIATNKSLV